VAVGFIARTYVRQSKVAEKKWRRFGDEHSTAELTVSRRGIDPIPQSGAGTLERTSVDDRKGCNWSRDRLALGNPSQEMGVVAACDESQLLGIAAIVSRETHTSLPFPSAISMCHTWLRFPKW
jgi:hypothetical protein